MKNNPTFSFFGVSLTTGLLCLAVLLLMILPLYLAPQGSDFGGADGKAEEAITEIQPAYSPWFNPILEPPSGEIESLLFVLQASLGTGVIAYYFGYLHGKKTIQKQTR